MAAIEALGNGARAGIVKADASDPQSGLVIVKAAITLFGEERVDILIHNGERTMQGLLGFHSCACSRDPVLVSPRAD